MEDFDTLRHKSSEHARTVWINWNLNIPVDTTNWVAPSVKELLNFSSRLVDHYQSELGKRLYVEFSGTTLDQVAGFPELLEQLHNDGARIGVYSETLYPLDFWTAIKPFVNQMCLKAVYGEHDADLLIAVSSLMSDQVDLHINYIVDFSMFKKSVGAAKAAATAISEITINLLPPGGTALTADEQTRLDGANALVRRAAAENRTRPRNGHRGSMIIVQDGVETEITPRELLTKGWNEFQGWSCMAGVEQLVITNEGEILRGWCRQGYTLGMVRDEVVAFPISAYTCKAEACTSVVDLSCSKSWF